MADAGSVTQVLEAMQGAAAQASAVFVPEGLYLARLLIAISLVWFCVDCFHGRESWVGGGLRLAATGGGTLWAIQNWPYLTGVAVSGAHAGIGRLIGGYSGPTDLFDVALRVAERVWAEGAGASGWGPWTWWQAIVSGISGIIVLAALGLPGIMVYLAEFELLLGSALGPLILPMFCCSATSSFGWGPVNFLIVNALRLVMMGAVSYMIALGTSMVIIPGADETLGGSQLGALTLIAVTSFVACWGVVRIANSVVLGSYGALDVGAVTSAAGAAAYGGPRPARPPTRARAWASPAGRPPGRSRARRRPTGAGAAAGRGASRAAPAAGPAAWAAGRSRPERGGGRRCTLTASSRPGAATQRVVLVSGGALLRGRRHLVIEIVAWVYCGWSGTPYPESLSR